MPDLPDWSSSVSIDAATVTIPVSGTVSITSGTVTIANASIAVINATGTKITSARPPKFWAFAGNASTNPQTTLTPSLDADVQALIFHFYTDITKLVHLKVQWHGTPDNTADIPLELFKFNQNIYAIPILPSGRDGGGAQTTTLDITIQGQGVNDSACEVWEIFESAPLWLEVFPLPQLEANQTPIYSSLSDPTANGTWHAVPGFAAIANVEVVLFQIFWSGLDNVVGINTAQAIFTIGYGPDATHVTNLVEVYLLNGPPPAPISFSGAPLGRGNGLWYQATTSNRETAITTSYSLR